jgi:hypothetical protein
MTLKEIMVTEEYHTRSSSSMAAKYDSKLAMAAAVQLTGDTVSEMCQAVY